MCVYIYIYIHIIYVCVYVYIYIYIYVYINISHFTTHWSHWKRLDPSQKSELMQLKSNATNIPEALNYLVEPQERK